MYDIIMSDELLLNISIIKKYLSVYAIIEDGNERIISEKIIKGGYRTKIYGKS